MALGEDMGRNGSAKRLRLDVPPIEKLTGDEYLARMRGVLEPMVKIAAMYSSLVDAVVTDPVLMTLPIHDHAIVRGHAVFDTCTVSKGRLYRVDIHLDRHLKSAKLARISLPFGKTDQECKDRMRQIIARTVIASGLRDADVRYYTSAGPGDFSITPEACKPAFYVVVKERTHLLEHKGIKEYVVNVPLKPDLLATLKSNNYMLNALTAMASKDRGGHYGVLVDTDGFICESCICNCVFVTKDRRLVTPPFNKILAGTTARKCLELAKVLVEKGLLTDVSQEPVPLSAAYDSAEMVLVGGDSHLTPVTHLDDRQIGDGRVGQITKHLIEMIQRDMEEGTEDHYELSYA